MRITALIAAMLLLGASVNADRTVARTGQPGKGPVQMCETAVPLTQLAQTDPDCTPREQCCKVCSKGKACGNSCIRSDYTCRKGRGCACDSYEVCSLIHE